VKLHRAKEKLRRIIEVKDGIWRKREGFWRFKGFT
jgi:hypothetical protein